MVISYRTIGCFSYFLKALDLVDVTREFYRKIEETIARNACTTLVCTWKFEWNLLLDSEVYRVGKFESLKGTVDSFRGKMKSFVFLLCMMEQLDENGNE